MDVAFLVLLGLTSLTGLALLVVRATPAMGVLLWLHLATIAGLFLTAPYGKFAHVVYRYAALVRNRVEERRAG
jgi:citrate/tricarballylate utilization protein